MKHSLGQNWYRLSTSFSLLLFAFGFFIWSIKNNTAKAGDVKNDYNKNSAQVAPEGYYESNGSLYKVSYWKQGEKWQARWVLDFKKNSAD
jgi:hypothetical protein